MEDYMEIWDVVSIELKELFDVKRDQIKSFEDASDISALVNCVVRGAVNQNEKLHKRTMFHQKKISSIIIIIIIIIIITVQLSYSITLLSGVQHSDLIFLYPI